MNHVGRIIGGEGGGGRRRGRVGEHNLLEVKPGPQGAKMAAQCDSVRSQSPPFSSDFSGLLPHGAAPQSLQQRCHFPSCLWKRCVRTHRPIRTSRDTAPIYSDAVMSCRDFDLNSYNSRINHQPDSRRAAENERTAGRRTVTIHRGSPRTSGRRRVIGASVCGRVFFALKVAAQPPSTLA